MGRRNLDVAGIDDANADLFQLGDPPAAVTAGAHGALEVRFPQHQGRQCSTRFCSPGSQQETSKSHDAHQEDHIKHVSDSGYRFARHVTT